MNAKTIHGISLKEINNSLSENINNDFSPTLAIAFVPANQDWMAVRSLLDNHNISIFGATTDAQFTGEGIHENGIVILLLDMLPEYFNILITEVELQNAHQSGKQIAEFGLQNFDDPAFILSAAHMELPFEVVIGGIVERAGSDIMLAGGIAGSSLTFEGTIFTNDHHTNKGVISLVLDRDKVEMNGMAVSGWKPVGTEKTITKCVGPWIHTINDSPAMDVLQKYIGDEIYDDSKQEDIVRLNTAYPLQVKRDVGSPIMRPTLLMNVKEKSVLCGGSVSQGEKFRFSLPPDFDVIESVVESSKSVKEREMPEAEAMLVL